MGTIELKNISRSYLDGNNRLSVLDNVTVHVQDRQFVSMVGPSGCGKSTLLRILCGIESPDEGKVMINGNDITGKPGYVAYMPQKDLLFPWRTVLNNVILALEPKGIPRQKARAQAKKFLPEFGLEGFENAYPWMLSGGMRQRAAFLRTVLQEKDILALDEPFGALDALTRKKMQTWLTSLWNRLKSSIVFVTHDVEESLMLSDIIYIFSERPGRIKLKMEIDLPRPRNPVSREFIQLKEKLLSNILDSGEL